jgi:hypothetical protein
VWRSEIAKTEIGALYQRYVWFVVWPLLIFLLIGACSRSCSPPAGDSDTTRVSASAYGAAAVLAYLTASPADLGKLTAIFGVLVKTPDGQGFPLPQETVVAAFTSGTEPQDVGKGRSGWLVKETVITADGVQEWQVPVVSDGTGYRAVTLPGVIPAPPTSASIPSGASEKIEVSNNSELSVTLRDFFAAWLTGHGDLSRVADTTAIPVFATPPYASVQVLSASTGTALPQDVSGSLSVAVTVLATETASAEISYTLQLSASAGRWIVSSVSAAPIPGGQK